MLEKLTKTVRVSDPEHWYMENTVKVSLYVTPSYKGQVRVRMYVKSIDDFNICYNVDCRDDDKAHIQWVYDHLKKYMYDRMPDIISRDWLYEHGYFPD